MRELQQNPGLTLGTESVARDSALVPRPRRDVVRDEIPDGEVLALDPQPRRLRHGRVAHQARVGGVDRDEVVVGGGERP